MRCARVRRPRTGSQRISAGGPVIGGLNLQLPSWGAPAARSLSAHPRGPGRLRGLPPPSSADPHGGPVGGPGRRSLRDLHRGRRRAFAAAGIRAGHRLDRQAAGILLQRAAPPSFRRSNALPAARASALPAPRQSPAAAVADHARASLSDVERAIRHRSPSEAWTAIKRHASDRWAALEARLPFRPGKRSGSARRPRAGRRDSTHRTRRSTARRRLESAAGRPERGRQHAVGLRTDLCISRYRDLPWPPMTNGRGH